MTDKVEGDKHITLHIVWPIYLKLETLLAKTEQDELDEISGIEASLEANLRKLGREYMKKNRTDFEPTFYHKAMTFLYPESKKLGIVSRAEVYGFHNEIEERLNDLFPSSDPIVEQQSEETDEQFFEGLFSLDTGAAAPESELDRYIYQPVTCKVDPYDWWLKHRTIFPRLFELFLKFSCIPASSASSERVFSTNGNIITDKRSMILPDNVNDLVVMRNKL